MRERAGAGGDPDDERAGEIAGEATDTSVILQTRLTAKSGRVDGDLPGVDGVARFEIATNPEFRGPRVTPWLEATAENDHIVKAVVEGLTPGAEYLYRVLYGPNRDNTESGPIRSFATLPGPTPMRASVSPSSPG